MNKENIQKSISNEIFSLLIMPSSNKKKVKKDDFHLNILLLLYYSKRYVNILRIVEDFFRFC